MMSPHALFYALVGGILPALLWLWFWLREDEHPEPRYLLTLTFISGMIAVPLVLPFQQAVFYYWSYPSVVTVILWAGLEEVFKFLAAYVTALRRREMDEPIDAVIYMLTAALGFVALENTLFLLTPFAEGNIAKGLIVGNLRFIGSSVLHVVTSTIIGTFLGLSFFKTSTLRHEYLFLGLLLATGLHSLFNLFIIHTTVGGTFAVFGGVWVAVVVLLLLFEKVKSITS